MNLSEIKQKTLPILQSYGITRAAVFGSVARGEERADSDIDILVTLGKPMGMISFTRFAEQLEQSLNKKVDVITENSVNKFIKPFIMTDLKIFYEA